MTRETSDCIMRKLHHFRICVFGMSRGWSGISHPITESMQQLLELKDGVTCNKVVIVAIVTDCEECNKQALPLREKCEVQLVKWVYRVGWRDE